jgi:hypothetical protein
MFCFFLHAEQRLVNQIPKQTVSAQVSAATSTSPAMHILPFLLVTLAGSAATGSDLDNGAVWVDTDGTQIEAHGGNIIKVSGPVQIRDRTCAISDVCLPISTLWNPNARSTACTTGMALQKRRLETLLQGLSAYSTVRWASIFTLPPTSQIGNSKVRGRYAHRKLACFTTHGFSLYSQRPRFQ